MPLLPAAAQAVPLLAVNQYVDADGTPAFDADDTPGHDSSPNNGRVRTQDTVRLRWEWSLNDAADTNVTLTSTLPAGSGLAWVADRLPNTCGPGSGVSPDGLTLTCALGDRIEGSNGVVRPFVQVGSVLLDGDTFDVDVTVSSDNAVPVTTPADTITVTSAPNVDLVKADEVNGESTFLERTVNPNTGELGVAMLWPITLEVGGAGRGAENVTGTVTWDDDVSGLGPNAVLADWPVGVLGNTVPNACGPNGIINLQIPWGTVGINTNATAAKSATDSGTWACTQPGGPGTPIQVSVTGADLTGAQTPTQLGAGPNTSPIAPDRKILLSGFVPTFTAYSDILTMPGFAPCDGSDPVTGEPFGVQGTTTFINTVTGLVADGVSGNPNVGDDPANNTNDAPVFLTCPGGWSSSYESSFNEMHIDGGIIGYLPGEVHDYRDLRPPTLGGENSYYPITQTQTEYAGDGTAAAGDRFTFQMTRHNAVGASIPELSMCAKFDPATIRVIDQPGYENRIIDPANGLETSHTDVPGTPGSAVIVRTYNQFNTENGFPLGTEFDTPPAQAIVEGVDYVVEYGTGGYANTLDRSANVHCDDADSPTGWQTDTASVPGGPDAITKVRVRMLRPLADDEYIKAWVSFEVRPGLTPGTRIATSSSFNDNWQDPASPWDYDQYDPPGFGTGYDENTHDFNGFLYGDRLTAASNRLAITKSVDPPLTTPVVNGDTLNYSVEAFVDGNGTANGVQVIDIVPAGVTYVGPTGGNPAPDIVIPNGGGPGTTLLIWLVNGGGPVTGPASFPFTYEARVNNDAGDYSSLLNVAMIQAAGINQSSGTLAVAFSNTGGTAGDFEIFKQVVTPLIAPGGQITYVAAYQNTGSTTYDGADFVDVLPYNGDGANTTDRDPASGFTGDADLVSVTGGLGETIFYTDAPRASVSLDPDVALPGGYLWCELADFGNPGCPAAIGGVTAFRVQNPNPINPGDPPGLITVTMQTDPATVAGDLYTNNFGGRVRPTDANTLPVISNDVTATVITPGVSIDKLVEDPANPGTFVESAEYNEGDPVTWQITVTNTDANAPLTDVEVTDPNAAECDNTIGDLAGGDSVTYTCTAAGGYSSDTTNTATVDAVDPFANTLTDSDDAEVTIAPPAVQIDKLVEDPANPGTFVESAAYPAGAPVTWQITVTNTGGTTLTDVTVTDPNAAACVNNVGTLAAGASVTYTCTVAAGYPSSTTNTATATGTPPSGPDVTDDDDASITTTNPAITITKGIRVSELGPPVDSTTVHSGDPVPFQIRVTNTGDVALTNVTVSDPLAPGCDRVIGNLAVGATVTYTCNEAYTATTVNVATVTGDEPGGPTVTDDDPATVNVINPAIEVRKLVEDTQGSGVFIEADSSDGLAGVYQTGSPVTFQIVVTNTGDTDLTDVEVTDGNAPACVNTIGDLAAGASVTYTCTQAGFGDTTNIASVSGRSPINRFVNDDDPADVTFINPDIRIVKDVALDGTNTGFADSAVYTPGQDVTWRIRVTNTGDVDLTDVTVTDPTEPLCDNTIGGLASGATVTYLCTAPGGYPDDVTNTATVTGTPPAGPDVTDTDTASVDEVHPGFSIDKEVETTEGSGVFAETGTYIPGGPVTFQITVTNTGDTNLGDWSFVDGRATECDLSPPLNLPPGDSFTYTCTHPAGYPADTTNRVNVDATMVDSNGDPTLAGGISIVLTDSDPADVDIVNPAIEVRKLVETGSGSGTFIEADATDGLAGLYASGQPVTFRVQVTNTGDTDLTGVTVTDPNALTCNNVIGNLSVGATVTYLCTVGGGYPTDTTNTATGSGDPVGVVSPNVTDADTADVDLVFPGIEIQKTVETRQGSGTFDETGAYLAGQAVTWRITVTNTGDTALTGVTVSDPNAAACANNIGPIPAGQSVTYLCTVLAGYGSDTTNTAAVTGVPPVGPNVTDDDIARVDVVAPALTVAKTVADPAAGGAFVESAVFSSGQAVTFRIVVTNTGDVSLTGVAVSDVAAPGCDNTIGALAVGASVTYTCTAPAGYTSDTTNRADVTGTATGVTSGPITGTDTAQVDILNPTIDVQKQVETAPGSGTFIEADSSDGLAAQYTAGQPVSFRIVVTVGPRRLTGVTVTDPLAPTCNNRLGNVSAGTTITYTCTVAAGYTGDVTNVATAAGNPVGQVTPLTDSDPADVDIVAPAVTIDKTVENRQGSGAFDETGTYLSGQAVTWRIVVTNTGNTPLANVTVTDPNAAPCAQVIGNLAVGASVTYTCTVPAGYASNTTNSASVAGTPPAGPNVGDNDTAAVEIVAPAIAIDKTVETRQGSGDFDETGTYLAGAPVTFTIVVANTGTTDLDNVTVTDPAAPGCDTTIGLLPAGDSVTIACAQPAGYTGDTTNTATVTGDPVGVTSFDVTDDDDADVDVVAPAVTIDKTVETVQGSGTFAETGLYTSGQAVTWRITVTNTGDTDLAGVTVADPLAATCNNAIGLLPAGGSVTYTCTVAVGYPADTTNTADVTGDPVGVTSPDVTDTDTADVDVTGAGISIDKTVETANGSGTFAETGLYTSGQAVTWRITVTNTGDVSLGAVAVTDPLAAACDNTIGALAAGATVTYTCTVPGGYPADTTNTASVTGTPPAGPAATDSDTAQVVIPAPAIEIDKTVETREGSGDFDETGTYLAGAPVTFTITVTNTGNVDLADVEVTDPAAAACDNNTIGLLPAGASVTYTCTVTGGYPVDTTNTATVTGDPVGVTSPDVTAGDTADVDVIDPAVDIRKQVEATAGSGTFIEADGTDGLTGTYLANEAVTFRVTVTNTGDSDLTGVTVTDPNGVACNNVIGALAAGASVTYTCTVVAGYSVDTTNTAAVTGTPPAGPDVTDTDPADVDIIDPAVEIQKTVETTNGSGAFDETGTYLAGQPVAFAITVTNTGDTDLENVTVVDPTSFECDRIIGALAAGETVTYTCTVTGGYPADTTNVASVTGTPPAGPDVTDSDPADVDVVDPAVEIAKTVETRQGSGDFDEAGTYRAGQPVTFTIVVTNTGDTDLDNVVVADPLAAECDAAVGFLAAGGSDTYTCTVPAGYSNDVTNLASVTGDPVGVTSPDVTDSDTADVNVVNPVIDVQKQVETAAGSGTFIEADGADGLAGLYLVDSPVRFRVTVTNPGDTDLADVVVADPLAAPCNNVIGLLPAGATVTYTCVVAAGYADDTTNVASVTGTPPAGGDVTDSDPADVNVTDPAIEIDKTVETFAGSGTFDEAGTYTAGAPVAFTIVVTNTGDTDLTDVQVTDPAAAACDNDTIGLLPAGASVTYTCVVTGGYPVDTTNTATVTGTDSLGNDFTDDDTADVVIAAPAIEIAKTVETGLSTGDFGETGYYLAGDDVTFRVRVTNTGDTDLDNVEVTDPQAPGCDATVGFLAAGDTTWYACTVPAGYTADTTNVASVTGDPVDGNGDVFAGPVTDDDPADVVIAAPAVRIAKTVETANGTGTFAETGTYRAGQAVTFTIVVTNTGTADLADVTVTDPAAATCDNAIGDLAAGASVTYTCTAAAGYPADITNTADVAGQPVSPLGDELGGPVTDSDPADVNVVDPAIQVDKTVETVAGSGTFDETGTYTAGAPVTFTIVVTNTGDTDLGDVAVADPLASECDRTIGFLAAGDDFTYSCTVAAGFLTDTRNVAQATGQPPVGGQVTDRDAADVEIVAPAVEIAKTVETRLGSGDFDETGTYRAGQPVTFTIVVTNTGDTDLDNVVVTDPQAPACDATVGFLAAGDSDTYTCTVPGGYAGSTSNVASVNGDPVDGNGNLIDPNSPVADSDTAAVEILDPAIGISKQVEDSNGSGTFIEADGTDGLAGLYLTNEAVTFRVTVTNTGDTDLTDVTVTDPLAGNCNNVIGTLPAGETVTYTCTVPAGYTADTTNTATVAGQPVNSGGRPVGDPVAAADTADVNVIAPAVAIAKTVETANGSGAFAETGTYLDGQAVTFTVTVANTGDTDLADVTVTDPQAPDCDRTIGSLAAGATVTFACTVPAGYGTDTTNVASVTGTDPLGNDYTDDDPADVVITAPAIEIAKTVETVNGSGTFAETGTYTAGQPVTFQLTVTNTGTTDLTDVTVTDPQAAACDTVIGFLAAGDSTVVTCTTVAGYPADTTNTADVTGDPVGVTSGPVTDTDPADVNVVAPAIDIQTQVETQQGSGTFVEADATDGDTGTYLSGQAVTWRIIVTNTGDTDLENVTVTAPNGAACNNAIGDLAAGASVTYECTVAGGYPADATLDADVVGTPVGVTAADVTDTDPASIEIVDPAIEIQKTVETVNGSGDFDELGTYTAGQPVTFTIVVTNTGDTDLGDVAVTDPRAPECDRTIGSFAAGASVTYTCTVADGYTADTRNVADVTGDPAGVTSGPVTDRDPADVDIVAPAITIDKTVETREGSGDFAETGTYTAGQPVAFQLTVTNTGDTDLDNVEVTDPQAPACDNVVGFLAAGASVDITCTAPSGYGADTTNTAAVTGDPVDADGNVIDPGSPVVDDDPADVNVVAPAIDIQTQVETQQGSGTFIEADATDGDTGTYLSGQAVTWRITVTNTGDTDLADVTVTAPNGAACDNVIGLLPAGASVTYTCTVAGGYPADTTLDADVVGTPVGVTAPDVTDTDPASIEIADPAIEIQKTVETVNGSGTYAETGTYVPGQPVAFTITVTNTGTTDLGDVAVTDPRAPECDRAIGFLAAGASSTYTCTAVDGYTADTRNVADVTGDPAGVTSGPVTDRDPADVEIVAPAITIDKTVETREGSGDFAETGTYRAGQPVTFTITVTNTGTADLDNVAVVDPLAPACDTAVGFLAAGDSTTFTCTALAGYGADTTNVADVTGEPVDGNGDPLPVPPVTADDPADVNVVNPVIDIRKQVETNAGSGTFIEADGTDGLAGTYLANEAVTFRVTVTNPGDSDLTDVTVTDPFAAACGNVIGDLPAGDSVTYTCAVPAGYSVDTTNVASVTGQPADSNGRPVGDAVTDDDSADVDVTAPAISIDKTVETVAGSGDYAETGTYRSGQAVTFTIAVTNTGDVDLTDVAVSDPNGAECDTVIGTLPAGATVTYTCTVADGYPADTVNRADVTGTDSIGTEVTDRDPARVDVVNPAIEIHKTVETAQGSGAFAETGAYLAGDNVTFRVTVTNTGDTDLADVAVTDALAAACDNTVGDLPAGDSVTYTCTVTGGYTTDTTNVAAVTGDPVDADGNVIDPASPVVDDDPADVNIAAPGIDIRKQVEAIAGSGTFIDADSSDGLAGFYRAGQPVTFRIVVTNTGDVALRDVRVADAEALGCNNVIGTLPASETATYTCTVPAGYDADTTNVADVTGDPVGVTSPDVTDSDPADVNVIDPAVRIDKTVETAQGSGDFDETGTYLVGQPATFTITVANTGDVDLRNVRVADPNAAACARTIGTLPAGATVTYTCTAASGYTADTTNTASATGTDPLGGPVTDDDTAQVDIVAPAVEIQKTVETAAGTGDFADTGYYTGGQDVTFTITVTNTGDTDLGDVTVTDPQAPACDNTIGDLPAGDSVTYTCTVTGGYTSDTVNRADVTGDPAGVTSPNVADDDTAAVEVLDPAVDVRKLVETRQGSGTFIEADSTDSDAGVYRGGQPVTFRIVVTNTGDADLADVTVTDPLAGTCGNVIGDLAAGATVTYTCTVTAGYADDTTNVADVTGRPVSPLGDRVGPNVTDDDPADVDIIDPAVRIDKTVETANGSGTFDETGAYLAGQPVTFTITVTNTGDADLGDVTVTDPAAAACDNTIGLLPAGATVTYTCTALAGYTDDTRNIADVTGQPTAGGPVTDDDDAQVDIVAPAVTIDKTVETDLGSGDFDETGEYRLGQDVTFTITVTNTGDTDLGDVTVTDPAAAACDNTIGDLPAGDSVTYTCTVTGGYTSDTVNRADVTGDPAGVTSGDVTDDDTAAVVILDSVLDIQKQVEDTQGSGTFIEADGTDGLAGLYLTNQAVTFRVTVTNTGNAALADVTVTDPLALGCNNVIGTLAAGVSVTYTCTVPAGYSDDVTNVADVVGQPVTSSGRPVGDELTDSDTAAVDVIDPAIRIDKTVETLAGSGDFDENGTYRAGQPVTWQITVTNTGDADLVDVTVTDPAAAACDNTIGDLPAGASVTYTCTVSGGYTADTVNAATAAGVDPLGNELTDDDTAQVDIVNPAVEIQKAVETGAGTGDFAETGYYAAGDDVTFTITVTNTGDADLDNVVVTDPNAPGCDTAVGFLAAGDSTTFTCTAPAGDYTNTADVAGDPVDANGDPLGGPPVTDTDTADVVALDAGLEISKQVETANGTGTFIEADSTDSRTGLYLTNQAVTWRITVANTGDADLVDVTVTDPAAPLCDTVVGALAAGATVTYDCTVPAGYSDDVTNTASVTGQPVSPLGDPVGDELTDDDTAAVDVIDPAIRIDKTVETGAGTGDFDENGTYRAGQPVTWQITVTNTGDTDLVDVTVTDPNAAACDNDTIGDLPAGASVTYTCTAADGYPADTVNTATVTGVDPLGNELTDSDTAAVDVIDPAIRIDKTVETGAGTGDFDENGTYRAGQPVTWQITVTNTGDTDLVDVTVTDPAAAACDNDTIGDLPAGASVTYTCTAADGYTADTVNTATVTGQPVVDGNPVGDPVTDDDTAAVTIRRPVDVSVTKGLVTALRAGQDADWRIVVTNNGPVTALAPITVTDTLPADLAFVQVRSGDAACSASGQTVTCVLDGDLPVGAHADIVITTRVDSDMRPGQQIVNRASVTLGSQDDTDATNDRDAAVGQVTAPPAPPVPPGPTPPPPGGSPSVPTRFLAYTGDHIAQIALLAGLVLVSGLVLIAVRRRRRSDENE